MHFDLITYIIGVVTGSGGASIIWSNIRNKDTDFFSDAYNDLEDHVDYLDNQLYELHFVLMDEVDHSEALQQELASVPYTAAKGK